MRHWLTSSALHVSRLLGHDNDYAFEFKFMRTIADDPKVAIYELESAPQRGDGIGCAGYPDAQFMRSRKTNGSFPEVYRHVATEHLEAPPHAFSMRRFANDTEMPGLACFCWPCDRHASSELDGEPLFNACVRVEWQGALSALLVEERLRQLMSRRWVRCSHSLALTRPPS